MGVDFNYRNATYPTFFDLRKGVNGDGVTLGVSLKVKTYDGSTNVDFNFTGLNESTSYTIYWAGASENPITLTEFTDV